MKIHPSLSQFAAATIDAQHRKLHDFCQSPQKLSDPEHVHQTRVTIRRLRAALAIFREVLPETADHLREELSWLASSYGALRDLDVQLAQINTWQAEDKLDEVDLSAIITTLQRQHVSATAKALSATKSKRCERLLSALNALVTTTQQAAQSHAAADQPGIEEQMSKILSAQLRHVLSMGDKLKTDSPSERFHKMRIRCKRLRYALEFATPVYGPRLIKPYVSELATVQDALGAQQDALVALTFLDSLRHRRGLKAAGPLLDQLTKRYTTMIHKTRKSFPKVFRSLNGKAWRVIKKGQLTKK